MKKTLKLFLCLFFTLIIILSLCSCSENKFFSDFLLKTEGVSDLPKFSSKKVDKESNRVYHFEATEEQFNKYAVDVYDYLKSLNLKYFGTRGEGSPDNGFLFTGFEFIPCEQLSDFARTRDLENEVVERWYVFVWASDILEDGNRLSGPSYLEVRFSPRSQTMVLKLKPSYEYYYIKATD